MFNENLKTDSLGGFHAIFDSFRLLICEFVLFGEKYVFNKVKFIIKMNTGDLNVLFGFDNVRMDFRRRRRQRRVRRKGRISDHMRLGMSPNLKAILNTKRQPHPSQNYPADLEIRM